MKKYKRISSLCILAFFTLSNMLNLNAMNNIESPNLKIQDTNIKRITDINKTESTTIIPDNIKIDPSKIIIKPEPTASDSIIKPEPTASDSIIKPNIDEKKPIDVITDNITKLDEDVVNGAFTIGKKEYLRNDTIVQVDVATFIENSRTYVPVRYLLGMLGVLDSGIEYIPETRTVKVTKNDTILLIQIDNKKMTIINGEDETYTDMDVSPVIKEDRTFLPARYVAEALGYFVDWDGILNKVIIKRPKAVKIYPPDKALYVGSYKKIKVGIGDNSTYSFDDLKFSVLEGPEGGVISESKDATFNPRNPDFMLIAGYKPGKYTLEARNSSNVVVATAKFEVTVHLSEKDESPSFVGHGIDTIPSAGSTWGGGSEGLQNMNTNTATGTRKVALVFVDTNEQLYSADAATIDGYKDNWRNNIINGTAIDGIQKSLKKYYKESSFNNLDFSMDIYGPYHLDGNWNEVGPGAGWFQHAQEAITIADPDINYSNYDTVLVVSQSVGAIGAADAKYAWPTASIGEWSGWVTGDGPISFGTIQMPNDWKERDGREVFATASHEMAHNLGMGDLYTPYVPNRNLGAWSLMDADGALPCFSLPEKMRLGWIQNSWVKPYNFASAATSVNDTITLKPVLNGDPGAGNYVGAEIRLSDGLNYYFEYRKTQAGKIGDLNLPSDSKILGLDTRSGTYEAPILRPDTILLQDDSDGDGSVLGNGQNYSETDNSTPIYPVEFKATASDIDGTKAKLNIKYGVNDKPDPLLRPWGAPPWQSPDIEVRNARNLADSSWYNVPWSGNPNDVIAKVKNNGQLNAPGVRVNFYVKNYTVGGNPPETYLGTDVKDIAAGSTVEFKTNWIPPEGGHYCIVARIPLYVTPGATPVAEMTELNNIAQSNYDKFISSTASPAERKITKVTVGNPYDKPTQVYVTVKQTNPLYRTYIEHKWLDLEPNETREVTVMYEYAGKTTQPFEKDVSIQKYIGLDNTVSITGYALNPNDKNPDHAVLLGGAGTSVATGKATKMNKFSVNEKSVSGYITTKSGERVLNGTVILTIKRKDSDKIENITRKTESAAFSIEVALNKGDSVTAYFVPPAGYGDCTSKNVIIE